MLDGRQTGIISFFASRPIDFTPDVLYFRSMRHQWSMLLLLAVMTCCIAAVQCQAQPTSATAATVDVVTPAPTITYTPTVIPEPSLTPSAISDAYPALKVEIAGQVVEVTPVSAQQILQFQQWEKQNADASCRSKLAWCGFAGAIVALGIALSRSISHYNQVHEQMMTSFRERLFSKDPGAVIAAAMSLSAYPREAIWLVMRFAEEHKREKLEGIFYKDPHQIKQAIQDAMSNMSKRYTWYWKPPFKIRGARLDGKTISIDIGPINLNNAYMVGGDFSGIGLEGAKLNSANLQDAKLRSAKLQDAYLAFAKLQKAYLGFAKLQKAYLCEANLQKANLNFAILQKANLCKANLQEAYLSDAELGSANLNGANLRKIKLQNAELEDDYLSYAKNMGAILDDEQKQKVLEWENDHTDAPWLNTIPCWWVYRRDENRRSKLQNDWAEEMGEYIDKIREEK